MNFIYKDKYLKYKNKYIKHRQYLELKKKQYGGSDYYSWFIIDDEQEFELEFEFESELESKYDNGKAVKITFRDTEYYITADGKYRNGSKLLRREQKIINDNIDENTLFEALRTCASRYKVVLRVAGGWVRDKILRRQNDDIDIAVDIMTGKTFSEHLFEYVNRLGNGWECFPISIIAANAEKSKNLETATLKLKIPNDKIFELDFVGLRTEVYDDESRVPVIKSATAPEDAMRRDLTINSLFYNINTGKIEDYIGGVRDIHCKIIRTPLPSENTFNDDPLRILRALRFLSRFQFTLDETIKIAMRNHDIQEKLGRSIARDRIGKEIEGFFKDGSQPILAFREIYDNGLWNIIFGNYGNWGQQSMNLIERLEEQTLVNVLATLTYPLFEMDIGKTFRLAENTTADKCYLINLRLNTKIAKISSEIHKCIYKILTILNEKDPQLWKLSEIAFIIRDVGENLNNVIQVGKTLNYELFNNVNNFIKKYNLEKSYEKQNFRTDLVTREFGVTGRKTGVLLKVLLAWQFDNPGKGFEDAIKLKDFFLLETDEKTKEEEKSYVIRKGKDK